MNLRSSFIPDRFKDAELAVLLSLLALIVGMWVFFELTDEVLEAEILGYDEWIMNTFRYDENPAGPSWIPELMRDITSLGSTAVLIMVIASVSGFLALQKKYRSALLIILSSGSGVLVVVVLKNLLARERPDVISHLVEVTSLSYPSGHAMMSAVVYLTLASMISLLQDQRYIKIYCIGLALLFTFLIGISRIYLGVHYPSDVMAGWSIGLAWAAFCWLIVKWTGWSDLISDEDGDMPE